jgi:hypothetical protein
VETYVTDDDERLAKDHFAAHYHPSTKTAALESQSPCYLVTDAGVRGLCSAGTTVGDVIVVLYGGTTPFILREESRVSATVLAQAETRVWQYVGGWLS